MINKGRDYRIEGNDDDVLELSFEAKEVLM